MTTEKVTSNFIESAALIEHVGKSEAGKIVHIANTIIESYKNGGKVLIAGNGGSAADAQHIAAELVNSFYKDRKALPAIALTTDTSVLTAWANDKNYDLVFERQIEAHGNKGDIFIAITTSGNSRNLLHALAKAKEKGLVTIALLGKDGGKAKGLADHEIIVPHNDTARIQECHHVIYHALCELVESAFSP